MSADGRRYGPNSAFSQDGRHHGGRRVRRRGRHLPRGQKAGENKAKERTSPLTSTTRAARTADVARMGTKAGGAYAVNRARRAFASAERKEELDAELQLRTAEQVAEALGSHEGRADEGRSDGELSRPRPARADPRAARAAPGRCAADGRGVGGRSRRARARGAADADLRRRGIRCRSRRRRSARCIAPSRRTVARWP